jgi:hypothetical protein
MKATAPLQTLAMLVGVGFMLLFAFLATQRLLFPFELTWLESYIYAPVLHCLRGLPIYEAPSFTYASCNYPPLYFNLSALVSKALGLGPDAGSFLPMRLVSLLSTLVTCATVLWVLRFRRQVGWRIAVALAAVYLASFGRFEGWLDSSRVDPLMCMLFFLATAFMLEGQGWRSAILAGLFGGLAGLVKQPALVYIAGIGLFLAVVHGQWKRMFLVGSLSAVVALAYLTLTGDLFNHYFYYWLFEIPSHHPRYWKYIGRGLGFLAVTVPILLVAGLFPLLKTVKAVRTRAAWQALPTWTAALAITTVCALLLRTKQGASINFFMPVFLLATVAAVETANRYLARYARGESLFALGCLVQLLMLAYNPMTLLPTAADAQEAQTIVASLRAVDGPVWFGAFPSYSVLAGKPWVLQDAARMDFPRSFVTSELSKLISAETFGAIILPANETLVDPALVRQFYQAVQLPLAPPPFLRALHDIHFFGKIHVRRDLVPAFIARVQPLFKDRKVVMSELRDSGSL